MKKILLMAVAVMMTTSAFAQETIKKVRLYKGDAIVVEQNYDEIDSIVFVDVEKPIVVPTGAISGKFTINANGDQVFFSQGNLQYHASLNIWRFAENQYDMVGNDNSAISSTSESWIDLFGWGTSGYDNTANDPFAVNYQPWATSTNQLNQQCTIGDVTYNSIDVNIFGYGPSTFMTDANLTGTSANYDWGVYNAISNGGNEAGLWRTLTIEEWEYIFNSRNLAQHLRSLATVCGVRGYVLLPDDFTSPAGISWCYQTKNWDINTYDLQEWRIMEATGAVFLPAAGLRDGAVKFVKSWGFYWSASYYSQYEARDIYFNINDAIVSYDFRFRSRSVRLVRDAE